MPRALAVALLLLAAPLLAGERRLAIVVGNHVGSAGGVTLRFAGRDAERVAQTLTEIGRVARQDLFLLLDQDADALRRAFAEADRRASAGNDRAVIFFYYSGHADETALELGPSRMPWTEVRALLQKSTAALRVGIIDSCQAGSLVAPKGVQLGPPVASGDDHSQGTALLVSAASGEVSQETTAIGGSYFTHFLVSALRGAADENGDGRVTLSEAHAYTTAHTRAATASWARSIQHPLYEFDLSGQGEVMLTDLREAEASIVLPPELSGHLVVTEQRSPQVVVETEKLPGRPLALALPKGRYVIHLRRENAVYLAEVTLPWGGRVTLQPRDLSARSYQEVAQKGERMELRWRSLAAGAALQSGIVDGMGPVVLGQIRFGLSLGRWELGVRLFATDKEYSARDTSIDTLIVGGGLSVTYELPLRKIDLRVSLVGEGQYWRQEVRRAALRQAGVFGCGLALGLRIPVVSRLFVEPSVEGMLYFPNVAGRGVVASPTIALHLLAGVVF